MVTVAARHWLRGQHMMGQRTLRGALGKLAQRAEHTDSDRLSAAGCLLAPAGLHLPSCDVAVSRCRLFGESEEIVGYDGLSIDIWLSPQFQVGLACAHKRHLCTVL